MNLDSGILGDRYHNQLRAMWTDMKHLKQLIRRVQPNRNVYQVLFLHDSTRPHTSLHTREAVGNNRVDCSPSSSLQPQFRTLQLPSFWSPEECHFAGHDKQKHGMCEELQCFSRKFYVMSTWCLMQRWENCVDIEGFLV
jgi:hypothetical protein